MLRLVGRRRSRGIYALNRHDLRLPVRCGTSALPPSYWRIAVAWTTLPRTLPQNTALRLRAPGCFGSTARTTHTAAAAAPPLHGFPYLIALLLLPASRPDLPRGSLLPRYIILHLPFC